LENIENKLINSIREGGRIDLISDAPGVWKINAAVVVKDADIYCEVDDPSVYDRIKKYPRAEFSSGSGGIKLKGRGLARYASGADIPAGAEKNFKKNMVLFEPYRAYFTRDAEPAGDVFEKSKLGWITATAGSTKITKYDARFWLKAARFVSVPMSVIPVVAGSLMALIAGSFRITVFLAALAGGVAAHLGVNFLSDYNDYKKGFDTPGALSSHVGALASELVKPVLILKASLSCFAVTGLAGLYLIYTSGWQVIVFGIIGVAGGASYTAGPLGMKYRGMGELLTSFLMGPLMVMGAYYVQTGSMHIYPLLVSLCLGLLVGSVTLANNIRDMVDDGKNGFITLPMKTGFERARNMYYAILIAPFLIVVLLAALQHGFIPVLIIFFSLPFAIKCINAIKNGGSSSQEIRLSAIKTPYPFYSIQLYTRFSVLMLAGLALSLIFSAVLGYKLF
jgi:1,4-dihydroxy-2-naphthoate octaprenyltransferase